MGLWTWIGRDGVALEVVQQAGRHLPDEADSVCSTVIARVLMPQDADADADESTGS
jgi:hypothetical protein